MATIVATVDDRQRTSQPDYRASITGRKNPKIRPSSPFICGHSQVDGLVLDLFFPHNSIPYPLLDLLFVLERRG